MGKIIYLKGRGNSGKTSTINNVFNLLVSKYKNAKIDFIKKGNDIKLTIEINGILVGIESQGDPNSRLKKSLDEFEAKNCDIIFCATRTSGMTVDWVKSHSKNYNLFKSNQTYTSKANQTASNNAMAINLIKLSGL